MPGEDAGCRAGMQVAGRGCGGVMGKGAVYIKLQNPARPGPSTSEPKKSAVLCTGLASLGVHECAKMTGIRSQPKLQPDSQSQL